MAKQTKAAETPIATPEQPEQTATEQPTTPPASFVKPTPVEQRTDTYVFEAPRQLPSDATPAVTGDDAQQTQPQAQAMTQAEIDKIIAARLKQERAKYADYDELKKKVQAAEDANKTEAERNAERLRQLETENQRLAQERQELAVKSAFVAEASKVGLDPDAAYKLADLSALEADNSNVADLVKAVATKWPGLVRSNVPQVAAVNPSKTAQPPGRTDDDRRREYFGSGGSPFWQGAGVRFSE
jgi:hypothetical protein